MKKEYGRIAYIRNDAKASIQKSQNLGKKVSPLLSFVFKNKGNRTAYNPFMDMVEACRSVPISDRWSFVDQAYFGMSLVFHIAEAETIILVCDRKMKFLAERPNFKKAGTLDDMAVRSSFFGGLLGNTAQQPPRIADSVNTTPHIETMDEDDDNEGDSDDMAVLD